MDTIDMRLIQLLCANCRLAYADLAEQLGLSVNAVHKRLQQLIEQGVIKAFTAKVSLFASNAMVVFISGTSQLHSVQDLPEKLRHHGSIYWLTLGGDGFVYIGLYLKNLNDLQGLIDYVKTEAKIPEPSIGILAPPVPITTVSAQPKIHLTDLDYRIIQSLGDNARKPLSDVADELNVSAKTIRRRLSYMIDHFLIELTLEWYPDKSNDIITLIDLHLAPAASFSIAPMLLKKYEPHALFYWTFANIPGRIILVAWTNTMHDLQTLRDRLEHDPQITSITPHILYTGFIFKTWRDTLSHH